MTRLVGCLRPQPTEYTTSLMSVEQPAGSTLPLKIIDFSDYNVKFLKELGQRPSHCKQRKPWIETAKPPADAKNFNYGIVARACELTNLLGLKFLINKAVYCPEQFVHLDLTRNKVEDLSLVTDAPQLTTLILNNNKIIEFGQLEPLKKAVNLRELSLVGNLVTTKPDYRKVVRQMLPQVSRLDGKEL